MYFSIIFRSHSVCKVQGGHTTQTVKLIYAGILVYRGAVVRLSKIKQMNFYLITPHMDVILPGLETPIDLPIIVIRSLPR